MKIKVMTFNLRCPVKNDGVNYFPNREANILNTIASEAPDIIGFQEVADYSREFIKRSLTDYVVLGCGRNENLGGEACSIAYKRDKFDLISYDTEWLSSFPSKAGSRYDGSDQSTCPRIFVHAELVCSEHGEAVKRLHFYNTHLDHKGAQARLLGMMQIAQSISECDAPFVLTGDMNARPGDIEISVPTSLINKSVKDATAEITHTFHGFGAYSEGYKIDYIYTDAEYSDSYAVEDKHENGVYISDHYPICTTIEI